MAAIGFIALFGQAVRNGVVMVSNFLAGGSVRLRTVRRTALLAMLGRLPMALTHGIGSETQQPLAVGSSAA